MRDVFSSLLVQRRVIGALLMREIITRYGRHNIGFLWLFIEPMLFTLGVTALWTATRSTHGSTLPIVTFAVTGYSTVLMWRNSATRCSKAIEPNLSLLYHRNVRVLDIFLSRVTLEVVSATASFIALALFFVATGWMEPPARLYETLVAWLQLIWFSGALGLFVGALSERSEIFERIWHTLTYLIFPLSGAVFMVDWLPIKAQEYVLMIPMVHAVELVREGYFGLQVIGHGSHEFLATFNLALTLIGLLMTADVSKRVEPE